MGQTAMTFQDLLARQKAHCFVLVNYRLSKTFPKAELYGWTSQSRRAAVSIAANIAEGSLECRYYLILVKDFEYGDGSELDQSQEEISRLLEAY